LLAGWLKEQVMEKTDSIKAHDEEAHIYDQQVREYEYFGFDVLFGMKMGVRYFMHIPYP
jgi:hypothetical protein